MYELPEHSTILYRIWLVTGIRNNHLPICHVKEKAKFNPVIETTFLVIYLRALYYMQCSFFFFLLFFSVVLFLRTKYDRFFPPPVPA